MSDEPVGVSYFSFWVCNDFQGIPASSARSMIVDDAWAARETQELAALEVERREAEMMHAVRSGRARAGLAGVFAAAERHAKAEDYRAERQADRDRYGEAEMAARHDFPATEYELDGQLNRARELHTDLVWHQARTDYGATVAAARYKSESAVR
jgi:hypothetical protein